MIVSILERRPYRAGYRQQIVDAGAVRVAIQHKVELLGEDQNADARQHAVNDGGRNGAEPLAKLQRAGRKLDETREQNNDADHLETELLDELVVQHRKTCRRTGDLQGRAGDSADDNAADNAGDNAGSCWHTRGERNAHAQRQSNQEHDNGRQ